jgi:hypothetical protein
LSFDPTTLTVAERWVRSVKEEYLSKFILFGEATLRRTLSEFIDTTSSATIKAKQIARSTVGAIVTLRSPPPDNSQQAAGSRVLQTAHQCLLKTLLPRRMRIFTIRGCWGFPAQILQDVIRTDLIVLQ